MDAEDDEVEIVLNFAFDFERLESYPPTVLIAHPSSDPTLKATVCAVTRGNIAEVAATVLSPPLIVLLSVRNDRIQGRTERRRRGSQSILIEQ